MIREAEARRSASIISSSSISESLTLLPVGDLQIDCKTKTSAPRTFSLISMRHSSFLNLSTSALPRRVFMRSAIARASLRFEFPLKSKGG